MGRGFPLFKWVFSLKRLFSIPQYYKMVKRVVVSRRVNIQTSPFDQFGQRWQILILGTFLEFGNFFLNPGSNFG